ncbi:MAG: hypothetical protein IAE79_16515 [Anaerolinea sp.]|nr:hypothetical protein [Anaerolinea sp.]
MSELHEKYAPILHFNKNEQFFPMRVEDMLAYSSLHTKDETKPLTAAGSVTPDILRRHGRSPATFLRTINSGPFFGQEVINEWGTGALEMVYRWAAANRTSLNERLAQKAYSWFSPKTQKATQLFWWNGLLEQVLKEHVSSAPPQTLPRLILPTTTYDSAVANYQEHKPAYAYYYRQVVDGDYLCLQYWFFYSFNNWGTSFAGMNDHEGDWEGMMLFFKRDSNGRPQEPPAYVTYADHESRQTKPWGHDDLTIVGAHPVGYAAGGSHATYPQAETLSLVRLYSLFDYATGDGRTIDHTDWVHRINLDDTPWLGQFYGSYGTRFWLKTARARTILQAALALTPFSVLARQAIPDEIELPGVSAPRGPIDPKRPQYAQPVAWAGIEEVAARR